MNTSTYELVLRNTLIDVAWDHSLKKPMAVFEGIYASTNPSIVQHIGETGLWSNSKRFDIAKDYYE